MRRPPREERPRKKKLSSASWRTRSPEEVERVPVVIAGFGRLGGALALGLDHAGWKVSVFPRSGESLRRAADFGMTIAEHEQLREAGVCILAVPDATLPTLSQTLRGDLGAQTALVHCAGALDLSAFGSEPETLCRPRGSFHPLCAISSPEDLLAGHSVALSASDKRLMGLLHRMASDLELAPIEVSEARRAVYHAGAVLAAGGLTSLASAAVACLVEAGIDETAAVDALLPLMHSALRGVATRGLAGGMTGPVVRGDVQVVKAHLEALPAEQAELYRILSLRMLRLVGAKLPAETRLALDRLLKD